MAYLEDEYGDIVSYYSTKEQVPHLWPASRVLAPWRMGEDFFWETKRGVLSYVIARPLMSAVSVVANLAGGYCEGEFSLGCAYPYVALVNNCTQMWALYCLVLLYKATCHELAPIRPLPKFIAIKAVVFFSFWQSLAIQIAADVGLIRPAELSTYDTDDVAAGLNNFILCLEMFAAAIGHAYAFPPRDYMDPSRPPPGFLNNVRVMFDVRDVVDDVGGVIEDTLHETQGNIHRATRQARDAAVDLVTKPLTLIGFQGRRRGGANAGGASDEELESGGEQRALLPPGRRSPPSPAQPQRTPSP